MAKQRGPAGLVAPVSTHDFWTIMCLPIHVKSSCAPGFPALYSKRLFSLVFVFRHAPGCWAQNSAAGRPRMDQHAPKSVATHRLPTSEPSRDAAGIGRCCIGSWSWGIEPPPGQCRIVREGKGLVVTSSQSDMCVLATALDSVDLGCRAILVPDRDERDCGERQTRQPPPRPRCPISRKGGYSRVRRQRKSLCARRRHRGVDG